MYEVVELSTLKAFEQLLKDEGIKNFYVFANVNPDIITASEVINKLKPVLDEIEKNGVKVVLKGEAEKNADLKRDGSASPDKVKTDGVHRRVHVGWSSQQIPVVFLEVVSAIEGTLITLT